MNNTKTVILSLILGISVAWGVTAIFELLRFEGEALIALNCTSAITSTIIFCTFKITHEIRELNKK